MAPGGRTQVPTSIWFLRPALLPCFPPVAFWTRIQYQGQRMNLALSLSLYLRTSGSEPGVLHRVSPSFQLNRLSEYPGLLRDSRLLPTWFRSLESPNKLAVPKWIGFHCDRLIRSLHLHLDQVTANTISPMAPPQATGAPTEGTAAQPHGRVLPATEPSSDQHNCSKSLQQVPGVAKLFISRTERVPLSDAWCQPGPSAFCRGVSVLAFPPTAWQYFKAGGKITQGWATSISIFPDGLSNGILYTYIPLCIWRPLCLSLLPLSF